MKKLVSLALMLVLSVSFMFSVDFYSTTLENNDKATIAAFESLEDLEQNILYSLVFMTSIYSGNPEDLTIELQETSWEALTSKYWDDGYKYSLTISNNICRLIKYTDKVTYRKEIKVY